jgi:hypothetical protein
VREIEHAKVLAREDRRWKAIVIGAVEEKLFHFERA